MPCVTYNGARPTKSSLLNAERTIDSSVTTTVYTDPKYRP